MNQIIKEFKEFVSKGNVLDLAVGIVIGAAFGKIVSSLVADIIMPIVGLVLGKVNFTSLFLSLDLNHYDTLELAKKANAPLLMYGNFIQTIVDFLIVGFAIFMVVKLANKAQKMSDKENIVLVVTTKECGECCESISIKAKKCPHCQSIQSS